MKLLTLDPSPSGRFVEAAAEAGGVAGEAAAADRRRAQVGEAAAEAEDAAGGVAGEAAAADPSPCPNS